MRGRLIQRFKAEIARLDTKETSDDGGYDEDFREVVATDAVTKNGIGTLERREHTAVLIPCQIGSRVWEALRMNEQGNAPRSDLTLYFHFADLERLSLVSATTGESLLHIGDRLVSIRDYSSEAVIQSIRTPPGLYVTEANPSGWGLNMSKPQRNILRVTFQPRSAVV